ncbi:MAG: hypothetical protein M1822_006704 [Bathelium mastoideum]|nr:MAG: hypothetical protein M1822_006704 [Bathelium mastoideum]
MPVKRNLSSTADGPDSKVQRAEAFEPSADFSGPVKEKLLRSQRTGQACDRCKVRKIRCDGRPGGCSPCVQNNTECKTTDRITGRATSRGYTEGLEGEVQALRQTVHHLQQQLRDAGIEAKTDLSDGYGPASGISPGLHWTSTSSTEQSVWEAGPTVNSGRPYSHSATGSTDSKSDSNVGRASLPTLRSGLVGDNYLGVSSNNSLLTHGTSLSVFGMEINLNDFIPPDADDHTSPLSYAEFLSCACNARPDFANVPLPPYADCRQYALWYLKSVNPFSPVLHKSDFVRLIDKIYNEGYEPTPAEDVMVHMMLAIIKFQYAGRNSDRIALDESNAHYRHSLGHFQNLGRGHSIEDLQALAMFCIHMRNFPKPGAAWIVTTLALGLALEMGLHRSAKAWSQISARPDIHQIEMKKRVFWTITTLQINLGGKLGRPMPLRLEDIDVEYPEPMNDNLPDEPPKCSFTLGIQSFRLIAIYLQMYSTIYTIKAPARSYEPAVRKLERELRYACEQVTPELRDPSKAMNEDVLFAHYLKLWENEINLSVHHPALCRSSNKELMNSNLDHCLRAASGLLYHAYQLHKLRSLDTTWVTVTTFVAAIFTTLFARAERPSQMKSEDLNGLRQDMAQWLEIIGSCGVFLGKSLTMSVKSVAQQLLGSGTQLREALRAIIDPTLDSFEHSVAAMAASTASLQLGASSVQDTKSPPEVYDDTQPYRPSFNDIRSSNGIPQASEANMYQPSVPVNPSPPLDQHQNSYPAVTAAQYAYPEPSSTSMPSFAPNVASAFDSTPYPTSVLPSESDLAHATRVANAAASATSSHAHNSPPHLRHHHSQSGSTDSAFQMYQQPSYNQQRHPSLSQISPLSSNHPSAAGAPAAWRQFTEGMLGSVDPSQNIHTPPNSNYQMSAAALMELQGSGGGGREHGSGMVNAATSAGAGQVVSASDQGMGIGGQSRQIWPLMTYHMGHGGGQ